MIQAFSPLALTRRQMVGGLAIAGFSVALLGTSVLTASPAWAANAAESFVQQNIDKGYAILNASLADQQRRDQFRAFLLDLTDIKRIALFTLGPYSRGAAAADTDAFVSAFRDYAVAVYESRLSKYKGQSMKVTGSTERAADDIIVNTQVASTSGGQPINAAFRVRTDGGKMIVIDMQVEGIWLAISERDSFTSYLQQNGSSVPKLTEHLRDLTEKVRSGSAPQ